MSCLKKSPQNLVVLLPYTACSKVRRIHLKDKNQQINNELMDFQCFKTTQIMQSICVCSEIQGAIQGGESTRRIEWMIMKQ